MDVGVVEAVQVVQVVQVEEVVEVVGVGGRSKEGRLILLLLMAPVKQRACVSEA